MNGEKIRLFVALELPEPVREGLLRWRSEAVRGLDGLRLIAAPDLHLTMCFLGWQAGSDVDGIAAACAAACSAAGEGAIDLAVGAAIWLPPRRPRVLAVELMDAGNRLTALQSALSDGLQAGGWYRPEQRLYRAHVTVARVGRGARVRAGELPAPPELRFCAQQLTLFRSRLHRSGARYKALAQVEIG